MRQLPAWYLEEAEDVKVDRHVTERPLLKTSWSDPHVQKIVQHATKGDHALEQALHDALDKKIKEIECVAKVSPILYEAAIDNMIETVLFDKYWTRKQQFKIIQIKSDAVDKVADKDQDEKGDKPDLKIEIDGGKGLEVEGAPKFDPVVFSRLVSRIKNESRSFFPLRNMIDYHVIHNPRIVISGNDDEKVEKRFGHISTAAATADGTFIFNKEFCQSLLNFAHVKGLKADGSTRFGKKYKSNGGEFPDEWEYIEFLIRHEFMHYTYADFYYHKIIKESTPTLNNWIGDFRSNHLLVQQGFNQLPMGLFSSYVNFHRQSSYMEMFNLVKGEFDKLRDECKKELEDVFDDLMDHHGEQGSNSDGTAKEVDRKIKPEDIDKWNKKVKERGEKDSREATDEETDPDYQNKPDGNLSPGTAKGGRHGIDYSQIKPRYKWEDLLKKMVGEAATTIDQSYTKVSRRAIGTMQQVVRRGAGAIKPGEIKLPNKKKIKLAVIVDSSGSMSWIIHKVMSNLDRLLVQRQGVTGVQDEFFLFIFSGDYDIYECTPGKSGIAHHIKDVTTRAKGENPSAKITEVLSHHKSGGTIFSSKLSSEISHLAGQGYNCLVISDGDMLWKDNFDNFKALYEAHRKHVWIMLDSQETFEKFVGQMKEVTNNATHLGGRGEDETAF